MERGSGAHDLEDMLRSLRETARMHHFERCDHVFWRSAKQDCGKVISSGALARERLELLGECIANSTAGQHVCLRPKLSTTPGVPRRPAAVESLKSIVRGDVCCEG